MKACHLSKDLSRDSGGGCGGAAAGTAPFNRVQSFGILFALSKNKVNSYLIFHSVCVWTCVGVYMCVCVYAMHDMSRFPGDFLFFSVFAAARPVLRVDTPSTMTTMNSPDA